MSRRLLKAAGLIGAMLLGVEVGRAEAAGSVGLTKVMSKLPVGDEYITMQNGPFCVTIDRRKSTGALTEGELELYRPVFDQTFKGEGFSEQPINLFDRPKDGSDLDFQVAALIHRVNVKFCMQGLLGTKYSSSMDVQWQVYSASQRKVVATIETAGSVDFRNTTVSTGDLEGKISEAVTRAFANNVTKLSEATEMKALLMAPAQVAAPTTEAAAGQARIALAATVQSGRSLEDATGSVVLVGLSTSFGSGVLISDDGYILTNEHVVGAAKTVTIRWSDGLETSGEVIRTHKGRDVALVKTDPRGRTPLPIRVTSVQVGDQVTAIGAPLDRKLQGTVTRGIVSARRVINGFSFIQSDVDVNHGNSGGPLLDDRGAVVGLTDLGLAPDGSPVGLNFFVPIKDAIDFLNLDLATGGSESTAVQKAAAGPIR